MPNKAAAAGVALGIGLAMSAVGVAERKAGHGVPARHKVVATRQVHGTTAKSGSRRQVVRRSVPRQVHRPAHGQSPPVVRHTPSPAPGTATPTRTPNPRAAPLAAKRAWYDAVPTILLI